VEREKQIRSGIIVSGPSIMVTERAKFLNLNSFRQYIIQRKMSTATREADRGGTLYQGELAATRAWIETLLRDENLTGPRQEWEAFNQELQGSARPAWKAARIARRELTRTHRKEQIDAQKASRAWDVTYSAEQARLWGDKPRAPTYCRELCCAKETRHGHRYCEDCNEKRTEAGRGVKYSYTMAQTQIEGPRRRTFSPKMANCENILCPCRAFREGDEVTVQKVQTSLMSYMLSGAPLKVEGVEHDLNGEARLVLARHTEKGVLEIRGAISAAMATVVRRAHCA
jgi:hypothetical protein